MLDKENMWFSKKPILALAPMADMTDSPFCRICREVSGKNFVVFREMVSAEAIVRKNEKTLRMCAFEPEERPIVLQIFGSDPSKMAEASQIIVEKFKPDGLDINMGCPVPKISGKSLAGAALMKQPDKAGEIIAKIKEKKLGVPISVKTRLGWGKDGEILTFAKVLEQAGADLLTIHGRTKNQGYGGLANWEKIGEVKKIVSIPIIANGDIRSVEDIQKCLEITGADGVMIGRSALGNPWIFKKLKTQNSKLKTSELIEVVLKHAKYHLERYDDGGLVTFRKHLAYYFKGDRVKDVENVKELRRQLMQVKNLDELKQVLHLSS